MSDKEILFQAVNTYIKRLVNNLFNLNSIGVDALITYVTNNMYDKYSVYLDLFTDKAGNINISLLNNAIKDIIKNQFDNKFIFNIFGKSIKFTQDDIDEFEKIFKNLKSNGKCQD